MKVKVTLWVGGRTFDEIVVVSNIQEAKETALSRNPTARVIAMNPVFD